MLEQLRGSLLLIFGGHLNEDSTLLLGQFSFFMLFDIDRIGRYLPAQCENFLGFLLALLVSLKMIIGETFSPFYGI